VLAAVTQSSVALKYASADLRADPEILAACQLFEERQGALAAHSVGVSAAAGVGLVALLTAAAVTTRPTTQVAEGRFEELPILEAEAK